MVICCHLVSSGHPKALPGFMNFSNQSSSPARPMDHRPRLPVVDASGWTSSICTPCDHLTKPANRALPLNYDLLIPPLQAGSQLAAQGQRSWVGLGMWTGRAVLSVAALPGEKGCEGSFCTTAQPICLKKNPLVHGRTSPRQRKGL